MKAILTDVIQEDLLFKIGKYHAGKVGLFHEDQVECACSFRLHILWNKPMLFVSGTSLPAPGWLHTCARHYAINFRRDLVHRRQHQISFEDWEVVERAVQPSQHDTVIANLLRSEQHRRLHQALSRLPTPCFEILKRYYFDETPVRELASQAGCSTHAIHIRLSRARRALHTLLNEGPNAADGSGGSLITPDGEQ